MKTQTAIKIYSLWKERNYLILGSLIGVVASYLIKYGALK